MLIIFVILPLVSISFAKEVTALSTCQESPPPVKNGHYQKIDDMMAILLCDHGYTPSAKYLTCKQHWKLPVKACVKDNSSSDRVKILQTCQDSPPPVMNGHYKKISNAMAVLFCNHGYTPSAKYLACKQHWRLPAKVCVDDKKIWEANPTTIPPLHTTRTTGNKDNSDSVNKGLMNPFNEGPKDPFDDMDFSNISSFFQTTWSSDNVNFNDIDLRKALSVQPQYFNIPISPNEDEDTITNEDTTIAINTSHSKDIDFPIITATYDHDWIPKDNDEWIPAWQPTTTTSDTFTSSSTASSVNVGYILSGFAGFIIFSLILKCSVIALRAHLRDRRLHSRLTPEEDQTMLSV